MKRITSYILLGIFSLLLVQCKESPFGQTAVDDVSPGKAMVTDVTAIPEVLLLPITLLRMMICCTLRQNIPEMGKLPPRFLRAR